MFDMLASAEQAQWLKRKVIASARPLVALWGAAGLAVILGAAGQLMLARALGPVGFGVIITANSIANMLGPLAAFGVGLLLIQKHGSEGWAARRWVGPSLRLSAVCLIATTIAFVLWCSVSLEQATERRAALLLAPLVALFAGVQLAESRFQLEHRYLRVAGWQLSKHVSIFAVALVTTLAGWTLLDASIWLSLVSASIAAFAYWAGSGIAREAFSLKGHGARADGPSQSSPSYAAVIAEAWPFAATSFVFLFFLQSSVAVVQWVSGSAAAGVYGVAISVMTAVYLLPRILYRKFFLAKVSRWHYQDRTRVEAFTWRIVPALAVLSAPLSLLIVLLAPVGIGLIFGPEFAGAALPLQILACAIPFRFISAGLTVAAVETRHVRERVAWQFALGVLAVAATVAMLPRFGLVGAAAVMLTAEIALASTYWLLAMKQNRPATANSPSAPTVAAAPSPQD